MKKQNGFVQLLTLTLLPFVLGTLLLAFSVAGVTQLNTTVQSQCRRSQIQTQKKIKDLLEKLFAKNPEARRLHTDILATEAEIAAAPPGVGTGLLTARLARLRMQQRVLGIYQKSLIQAGQMLLRSTAISVYSRTRQGLQEQSFGLRSLFQFDYNLTMGPPPPFPAEPEYPDTAPPYGPVNNLSERAALVQKWKYQLRMKTPLNRFVSGAARFEKNCTTTLEQEDEKWVIVTKEDRSSSKPSSY